MPEFTPEEYDRAILNTRDPKLRQKIIEARNIDYPGHGFMEDALAAGPSALEATMRGGLQGFSAGTSDEMFGALGTYGLQGAMGELNKRGISGVAAPEAYEQLRDEERLRNSRAQEAHGGAYFGGELAGGVLMPGGIGSQAAKRSTTALGSLGDMIKGGMTTGAVEGAGYSDADTLAGVAGDSALGMTIGGIMAPAGGAAQRTLSAGGAAISNTAKDMFLNSPRDLATRRLRGKLIDEGYDTADDVRAGIANVGPEGRVADLVPYEADQVAQMPGGASIRNNVQNRNAGQKDRIIDQAGQTIGPISDNYRGYLRNLERDYKQQAAPLYERAWQQPFQPSPQLARVLSMDEYQGVVREAQRAIETRSAISDEFGPGDPRANSPVYLLHEIKRGLDGLINSSGIDPTQRARHIEVRNRVLAELDSVDGYANARKVYAEGKSAEEVADIGRNIMRKQNIEDYEIDDLMRDFNDADREAFNVGLMRGVVERVNRVGDNADSVRKIAGSPHMRDLIRTAFPDEQSAADFIQMLAGEATMRETTNRVLTGSRTTRTAKGAKEALIDPTHAAISPLSAAAVALGRIWHRFTDADIDPETTRELADLLWQHLDSDEIDRIMRQSVIDRLSGRSDASAGVRTGIGLSGPAIEAATDDETVLKEALRNAESN